MTRKAPLPHRGRGASPPGFIGCWPGFRPGFRSGPLLFRTASRQRLRVVRLRQVFAATLDQCHGRPAEVALMRIFFAMPIGRRRQATSVRCRTPTGGASHSARPPKPGSRQPRKARHSLPLAAPRGLIRFSIAGLKRRERRGGLLPRGGRRRNSTGRHSSRMALLGYLQAMASNLVSAGLRLGVIGQTDGQRILAALEPVIAARRPQRVDPRPDRFRRCDLCRRARLDGS